MKAVRVIEGVTEFVFGDAPRPELQPGTVRVSIEATFLPTYFEGLPKGGWLTPPRPFTPGQCAIGVIEELDPAIAHLKVGQRVYCDMYVEGAGPEADQGFIGCFGINPPALRHLTQWPNGTLAEEFVGPEHCFTVIPDEITAPPEILCRLGWFVTAFAGFQRGGFRAGQRVAIHGASGLLGSCAALVACALGASEVRLIGRKQEQMAEIASFDPRIIVEEAGCDAPLDFVLDCAGGQGAAGTEALVKRLVRYGSLTFVGGLTEPFAIETGALMRNGNRIVGSFWFDSEMTRQVLALIASGAIDLAPFRATCFALQDIAEAMRHSVETSGGLHHVAVTP